MSTSGAPVYVTPRPGRQGGPPIWIGGWAEPAVRRAGRIADGFIASGGTQAEFSEQIRWAREEREGVGDHQSFGLGLHARTFAWNGPEAEAWDLVSPYFRYVSWKYDDMENARGRSGPPPAPPPMTAEEQAALREEIILGTPDQVAEQIDAYREAAGDDLHFIADLYWPGMDPLLQREAMRIFAEQVAPLVR